MSIVTISFTVAQTELMKRIKRFVSAYTFELSPVEHESWSDLRSFFAGGYWSLAEWQRLRNAFDFAIAEASAFHSSERVFDRIKRRKLQLMKMARAMGSCRFGPAVKLDGQWFPRLKWPNENLLLVKEIKRIYIAHNCDLPVLGLCKWQSEVPDLSIESVDTANTGKTIQVTNLTPQILSATRVKNELLIALRSGYRVDLNVSKVLSKRYKSISFSFFETREVLYVVASYVRLVVPGHDSGRSVVGKYGNTVLRAKVVAILPTLYDPYAMFM